MGICCGSMSKTKKTKRSSEPPNQSGEELVNSFLRNVPLLRGIPNDFLSELSNRVTRETFMKGDIIIHEGEEGDCFYIVAKGKVGITKKENGSVVKLATLTRKDYFGEIALLRAVRRTASAEALENNTECLVLNKSEFDSAKSFIRFPKRKAVSDRAFELFVSEPEEKSNEDTKTIRTALKQNRLLSSGKRLSEVQCAEMAAVMKSKTFSKFEVVLREGDEGYHFFVVQKGVFSLWKAEKKIGTANVGNSFGELALLHNTLRKFTAKCESETGTLWALHRVDFRRIINNASREKLEQTIDFLSNVPLLESLLANERVLIASLVVERIVEENGSVISEGESGDCFFIIERGTAQVTKGKEASELNRLGRGDYFGEIALLHNDVRQATVTAINGSLKLLVLSRQQFDSHLGPLKDLMERQIDAYVGKKPAKRKVSELLVESRFFNLQLTDLRVVAQLGSGSFGRVKLVRFQEEIFALKCMSKASIVELGQQEHVINEKRIMLSLHSPFIVRCYKAFSTQNEIFILLEACLGGELFTRLRTLGMFAEPVARFYLANVLEAFSYLHTRDIVYRDLKPENLMFAADGYLKLTDFGFAKQIQEKTWTLCGTPDYLAPEIVAGQGHGKPADIWTLGVLLFEMLVSYPPFYDEDQVKTYAKIMQEEPEMPSFISAEAADLIKKLLRKQEYKRLGTAIGGLEDIMKHPFFDRFSWESLRERKIKAPWIPKIKGRNDTANFEEAFDTHELESREVKAFSEELTSEWEKHF